MDKRACYNIMAVAQFPATCHCAPLKCNPRVQAAWPDVMCLSGLWAEWAWHGIHTQGLRTMAPPYHVCCLCTAMHTTAQWPIQLVVAAAATRTTATTVPLVAMSTHSPYILCVLMAIGTQPASTTHIEVGCHQRWRKLRSHLNVIANCIRMHAAAMQREVFLWLARVATTLREGSCFCSSNRNVCRYCACQEACACMHAHVPVHHPLGIPGWMIHKPACRRPPKRPVRTGVSLLLLLAGHLIISARGRFIICGSCTAVICDALLRVAQAVSTSLHTSSAMCGWQACGM